jgi:aldose 1-epimerase
MRGVMTGAQVREPAPRFAYRALMLEIRSDRVRATIVPELGAGLGGLWFQSASRSTPILRPAPVDAQWFNDLACYLLAPWPNRIASGRFTWEGAEVRIPPDWPDGTAIHGLVKDKPWEVVAHEAHMARLRIAVSDSAWPWSFTCEAAYGLYAPGNAGPAATFLNSLALRNTSDRPMPCGIGFHPFFAKAAEQSDVMLLARDLRRYPLEAVMPTGPAAEDDLCRELGRGMRLQDQELDEVFQGSCRGAQVMWPRLGISARLDCSANLGYTVLYNAARSAPPRQAEGFCLEPVSMVNNGLNLAASGWTDTGVTILEPGGALEGWWSLQVVQYNR